jgi:hypothetical protein
MISNQIERLGYAAAHQAKLALRAGRKGDDHEFARVTNRMYDTLEASPYPRQTAMVVIRQIGRSKAMVMKLDRELINLAL